MERTKICDQGYIIYPNFLFGRKLTDTAKLVYVVLFDRSRLSEQNEEFHDENSNYFVFYTVADLADKTGRSERTITNALASLEREGLITRQRQGRGFANKIYVILPESAENEAEERNADRNEPEVSAEERDADSKNAQSSGTEYDAPEVGEFFSPQSGKKCASKTQNMHLGKRSKCGSENAYFTVQETQNLRANKNNNNKNKINKNDIIKSEREAERPRGHYRNVCISDDEYRSLKDSYMNVDSYIERLSRYMKITGRSYACHDAVLRQWLEKDGHRINAVDYDHWEVESL